VNDEMVDMDAREEEVVAAASRGEAWAIKEIADRLDGDSEEKEDEPEESSGTSITPAAGQDDESTKRASSQVALRPTTQAAITSLNLLHNGKLFTEAVSAVELVNALQEQVRAVKDRDLGRGEAMLVAQAHTLDALYNSLLRKGVGASRLDPSCVGVRYWIRTCA
jgi:hypothetical protein